MNFLSADCCEKRVGISPKQVRKFSFESVPKYEQTAQVLYGFDVLSAV